jgi:hypothetical protein
MAPGQSSASDVELRDIEGAPLSLPLPPAPYVSRIPKPDMSPGKQLSNDHLPIAKCSAL